MDNWKLKDIQTVCFNLQNKITPFQAKETVLNHKMHVIRKELKCDEYTAWLVLRNRLRSEISKNSDT